MARIRSSWAALMVVSAATVFAQDVVITPPSDKYPDSMKAMRAYAVQPAWSIDVPRTGSGPESVRVVMPSPFGSGKDVAASVMPTTPQSSIYRFKYLDVSAAARRLQPFTFMEADWNTEGQPRGPNNSFSTPHYDFHFYTKDRALVDAMHCVTTEKTCDAQKTGHADMRPFLQLPPNQFLPAKYYPDTGSSIAAMGIHNLDGAFTYTVENVNHNSVTIYGSYGNEIAFLQSSVTLYAFQDAVGLAPTGKRKTWPIAQPASYAYAWWPTEMTLEYLPKTNEFVFALAGFKPHSVTPYSAAAPAK